MIWGAVGLLAGCSSLNPAGWFHRREGGAIAQPQQPTPGANQPYPNLATVPENPPPPDMAALEHISTGLIADRTNAQHLAAAAPLSDPSSPTASPGLFGVGTTAPPAPNAGQTTSPPNAPPGGKPSAQPAASASLPGANAAPAPTTAAPPAAAPKPPTVAAPPQRAPVGAVESAPLPEPTPSAAAAPLPQIPAAPPSSPAITGVGASPGHVQAGAGGGAVSAGISPAAPPSTAAAAASVPATGVSPLPPASRLGQQPARAVPGPVESTSPPANPADRVEIAFAPGSASVPPASLPALRTLADKRGNRLIEALGRGDAGSADPAAQEKAVTLGFARAQSIASALAASGVPRGAIQVMSLAAGSGGMAQLLE